ncbi:MAG: hypothetical protein CME03_02455 [Gemmatimonadaceae bacterium]|nr:hypothetical protein [Gemmatimonadaceae bacterium]
MSTHLKIYRRQRRGLFAAVALALVAGCTACSPLYVVRAGIAEIGILRARQPIHEILNDTTVDPDTRSKLAYVVDARRFAAENLGIDVGDSYTMFTQLDRDTLAMVVTAAWPDRLVPKTWWFPIVGHVPYKGHFSLQSALEEEASLANEGYDTWVRPTSAFSTLGWFNDPVLSTALKTDEVEVVTTVIHELAHQHLFLPGQVEFNESFATFVGRAGAARYFCTREGSGPQSIKCQRALARWRDSQVFSNYLDDLVKRLEAVYDDPELTPEQKATDRLPIIASGLQEFDEQVAPALESLTFASFRHENVNNATLLSYIRYYKRLLDFNALLKSHEDDLAQALSDIKERVRDASDAFDVIPHAQPLESSTKTVPRD